MDEQSAIWSSTHLVGEPAGGSLTADEYKVKYSLLVPRPSLFRFSGNTLRKNAKMNSKLPFAHMTKILQSGRSKRKHVSNHVKGVLPGGTTTSGPEATSSGKAPIKKGKGKAKKIKKSSSQPSDPGLEPTFPQPCMHANEPALFLKLATALKISRSS
ncbi:hypothetical protein QCA50_012614 [Cerrena zonata]|uniref:Uncharacterized protein n=1 Tax=Cerrena zonata TaxID=2478898 RepID=A0AAW0FZL5_9APHY